MKHRSLRTFIACVALLALDAAAQSPTPAAPARDLPAVAPAGAAATTLALETVFVVPRQSLPLLNLPQLGSTIVASVSTDDALSVLTHQGEFVQVRTPAGASGWIRSSNLTSISPAPPPDLAADNARLTLQVNTLDAQVRAFQDENAQLRQHLESVESELEQQTRAVPLTPAGLLSLVKRIAVEPTTWILFGVLLLALLVAFRFGVAHRDESIRQRFGGLDL